ncbi:MAG: rRNA pseudouridine synthase, partial [Chryseobacterium sp.]
MSRDNNNSERPKRPRISTRKNSDDSRASRSGNSSGSRPSKKPFPKAGERNSDSKRSGGTSYQDRMDKKFGKTEQKDFITNSSEGKKMFGKSAPKRGGSRPNTFDTRDKYERGSLKYGRRPGSGDDRNQDGAKSFVQKR